LFLKELLEVVITHNVIRC
ncbi:feS assembly protein SufB, partial [Chlamydia psittaci 84-8471/1]